MIKKAPFVFAAMLVTANVTAVAEEGSLITLMSKFQYFMHKTALSLEGGNPEQVKFYAHEIEENLEKAEAYGNYKEFHIGSMVKQILTPEFEKFEEYIDRNDLSGADQQFNRMIEACNNCHQSVQKGFIRIERVKTNPYLQSFTP